MNLFEKFILGEAGPDPNMVRRQQQLQAEQNPPDFTRPMPPPGQQDPQAPAGQDPNAMAQDPNQQAAQQDPNMQQEQQPPDPEMQAPPMQNDMDAQQAQAQGGEEVPQGPEGEVPQGPGGEGEVPPEEGGEEQPQDGQEEVPPEGDDGDSLGYYDPLQYLEKQVFSDIKKPQMDIKVVELKKQFMALNSAIVSSLEKINDVSRTTYDDSMIEFAVRKLMEIKQYSKDYLLKTFNTRTYIENQVELQRMIISFNMVTNLFSEIRKSRIKRQEEINKKNKSLANKNKTKGNPLIFTRGYDLY